jgi:hypothetical protein
MRSGFSLDEAWQDIDRLDDHLESRINYAFSEEFGYLTACPTNVGTGMRASVMLHLPALVLTKQIEKVFRALQKIAGAALGAMPEHASALAAFLGVGPKTPPRALKALEKAKEIAASDKGTPGQRTEKAWKAGGQFGGWDQLPTHAGETDWMRYVPTFAPGERAITAYDNRPSVYDNKGWFGRHKTDKQTGTVGELTNLNPALLNEFPDIADIPLTLKRGYDESTGGHFRPGGWLGKEKIGVSGYDDASMAESLAHELQHALSRRQGWSPGSNPSAEKRPWIAMGNDMKHYGDTAFDRYQKVVGEQIGDLEAKMHVNEAYKKDYSAPRSFPSYESIPQDQQRGKKYMVERSIEGKRPRDLPPSWQFTTKPENMRDPTTPLQNVLWHWPADVAKSLVTATSSSRFVEPNYWRDPVSGNPLIVKSTDPVKPEIRVRLTL